MSSSTSLFIQQSLPFSQEATATLPPWGRARILAIRQMMSIAAAKARHVVVQTDTMAQLVSRELGLDLTEVHIVRPGIPADVLCDAASRTGYAERRGDQRLLYVGNSSPYKNLWVVEQALDILHSAGKRPVLAATIDPARGLGLRRDVEALGMLDRYSLISEYRRASCVVMPSLSETVGLPLLEAMALSVPVVAADRPYAREICGSAALYFDPFAPESLAEAITRVVEDEGLRRRLIADGGQRAAEFSAGEAYDRLLEILLN